MVFITAEIGINHNGDMSIVKKNFTKKIIVLKIIITKS